MTKNEIKKEIEKFTGTLRNGLKEVDKDSISILADVYGYIESDNLMIIISMDQTAYYYIK